MRILLGLALATLLVAAGMAQDPKIDGPWYGTISPPGAQFDVGVTFQRRAGGWTGMLLLENGRSTPLKDITLEANAISFSVGCGSWFVARR